MWTMAKGAHKAPDFLAKNPFGQVPVIEDGDLTLPDSNAILVYLATRYDASGRWYPRDPVAAARVQQWLSVSAGQLAYGPAAARLVTVFGAKLDHERAKAIAAQLYAVRRAASGDAAVPRRRRADHRRRSDVLVHGACAGGRRVARAVSQRARMAGAHRGAPRFRADEADAASAAHRLKPAARHRMRRRLPVPRRRAGAAGARRRARPHGAVRPQGHPRLHARSASRAVRGAAVRGRRRAWTAGGRPWASVLAGPPGFMSSPDPRTLRIAARPG